MNIDNITSDGIALTNNGKEMLIKVYEQEIKRLKEEYVMLQNASDEIEEELQQRIDKAIEFINKFNEVISKNEYLEKYKNFMIIPKELLDILEGSDKE